MSYIQRHLPDKNSSLMYLMNRDEAKSLKQVHEDTMKKLQAARVPNFSAAGIMTKSAPRMSDDEYAEKIKEMAKRDFENGNWADDNPEFMRLQKEYISVASPDRKSLFAQALAQWRNGPNSGVRWDAKVISGGEVCGYYDINGGTWSAAMTKQEVSRQSQFHSIYVNAWREAKAASENKVDITA